MRRGWCVACGRPRLRDYFSGEGGAGRGYRRAGFCVSPVDNSAARLARYDVDCIGAEKTLGDAVETIFTDGTAFAARHASPPCTEVAA